MDQTPVPVRSRREELLLIVSVINVIGPPSSVDTVAFEHSVTAPTDGRFYFLMVDETYSRGPRRVLCRHSPPVLKLSVPI